MIDQHSEFRRWLATRLEQSATALADEWLTELIRLSVSRTQSLPSELLQKQVTSLLSRIFQALGTDQDPARDPSFKADVSALAQFRWAHGCTTDELVAELEVLSQRTFERSSMLARGYPSAVEPGVVFAVAGELRHSFGVLSASMVSAVYARDREDRTAWETLSSSLSRIAVHELRNRLNAAMLRTDLMLSQHHEVQESIDAALSLVSDAVEDISRLTLAQSAHECDHRTQPMHHLIERVIDDLSPSAHKAGVRVDLLPPLPSFHVDVAKAYLVLVSLVGSAITHARASRPPAAVELRARALPGLSAWRLSIAVHRRSGFRAPQERTKKESAGVVAARQAAAQFGACLEVNVDQHPEQPLFTLTVPEPPSGLTPQPRS